MHDYPYVITISSEKGGVGKTTLATNLAIFLKALDEDLPVTIFSFDNHFSVDKMFEIKGQRLRGDVTGILSAAPAGELLHTGQYGVNYIPSSAALSEFRGSVKSPMALAHLLAVSQLPGIVIIDTRPELDILTENALFAADQVIIPVKDMPSLENCRNIFELFDRRGLDKKSLALIPCLVDSRIKFDGPFRDQKTLLKAYAINRGYRCLDTFISKSPKVDSLNTNPDGRIYPILTHARGTEVYLQFTRLARMVCEEFRATPTPRAQLYRQWLAAEDERRTEEFATRRSDLREACLLCDRAPGHGGPERPAFYFEASTGGAGGFIEEGCFLELLGTAIYRLGKDVAGTDPAWIMLRESARESSFVFRRLENGGGPMVEFSRFDMEGIQLLKKLYPLKEYEGGLLRRERSKLAVLMSALTGPEERGRRDPYLIVHPVDPEAPEAILQEENYRGFSRLKKSIAHQLELSPGQCSTLT
jgi:chromosome partitioning protein